MNRRIVGGVLVVCGAVLVALAALADAIGIGEEGAFGYKQTIGVIVGGGAIVVGLALVYLELRRADAPRGGE